MKQLAIIPRDQRDIFSELESCIERLEHSGIQMYGTLCGRGYAILWAEGSAFQSRRVPVSRSHHLLVAQFRTQTGSTGHPPPTTVSERHTDDHLCCSALSV
jgi:hypothetical protein